MTVPVLVTPPTAKVVGVNDLKAFLRVDHDEEDDLIEALGDAVTAWLDGWGGVLGRAIMSQTWRQDFEGPGPHLLAMPDVDTESLVATVDGEAVSVSTKAFGAGLAVSAEGVTGTLRVTYACALPPERLPKAQVAVKLLVESLYKQRGAVADTASAEVSTLADPFVTALRWRFL